MNAKNLFDGFEDYYDSWFKTPIGNLVRHFEGQLILEYLKLQKGELILDAGCGTAVFTQDFLAAGAGVVGLDVSFDMLQRAKQKTFGRRIELIQGDMLNLPFRDDAFDKTVSITALEFIPDAQTAVNEMFRVTRPGGFVVLGTLNSLSPWAARRAAKSGKHILAEAFFRSPEEILALSSFPGMVATAIHFEKNEAPAAAKKIEIEGTTRGLKTGAFLLAKWTKPSGPSGGQLFSPDHG